MKKQNVITAIIFIYLMSSSSYAQNVKEAFIVKQNSKALFDLIKSRPEFTIDHVNANKFELYGPPGTKQFLDKNRIDFELQKPITNLIASTYPTPEETEKELRLLTGKFPQISRLISIGQSVKKRTIWAVKISTNVNIDDTNKPEFKYIANMHGDEIVGRELMMRLIKDLLNDYGRDPQISNLLERTQIYIIPSMNPDGASLRSRGNANNVDLNRNFPDFSTSDNKDVSAGREPETQAIMNWQSKHNFKLSANFHGGAEVVNYPWDTVASDFPQLDYVKELSLEYAGHAPYISTSTTFQNGITNGYNWYEVNGGMQDWSIYFKKDLQLTIELSNQKWPDYSQIDYYYKENKDALIRLIERVLI